MNTAYVATFLRTVPAFIAVFLAAGQEFSLAALLLALSVICDGIFVRIKKKTLGFDRNFQLHIEGMTDLLAFGVCPALFCFFLVPRAEVMAAAFIFVSAGIFRIARFNGEGLLNGLYRGLPITYNGYIFPAGYFLLRAFHFAALREIIVCAVLLGASCLMTSSKLRIKEVG